MELLSSEDTQTFITAVLTNMDEIEYIYNNQPLLVELVEICGGEARTSRLVARRRMRHGPNFDLVVGMGLTVPNTQQRVWRYVRTMTVLEAANAQVCSHLWNSE